MRAEALLAEGDDRDVTPRLSHSLNTGRSFGVHNVTWRKRGGEAESSLVKLHLTFTVVTVSLAGLGDYFRLRCCRADFNCDILDIDSSCFWFVRTNYINLHHCDSQNFFSESLKLWTIFIGLFCRLFKVASFPCGVWSSLLGKPSRRRNSSFCININNFLFAPTGRIRHPHPSITLRLAICFN